MNRNIKKLLILNIPYIIAGLLATNIGEAFRMASGSNASEKVQSLVLDGCIGAAFSDPLPSLHPTDLLIGIAIGAILRIAVYMKGKNARNFRHKQEYGSARWGKPADVEPYMDPVFANNVILSQTERITMNSRPADPKYARNKNVLVVGGSGSGKTRFFIKPNLLQMHSSYVVTDPKGTVVNEVGNALLKNGYRMKIFNTINFKKSMHYNPFAYVHDEKDILKLVTTLMANTKGEGKGGDPFWEKAEKLLYTALIRIRKLTPIQMPHIDMDEAKNGRKAFTKEEWIDILLRSIGMEPDKFSDRVKWLLLARMIPLVENNFNLCELGPRSTGKSYVYEQISPNSILIGGGQTTRANLFYNMSNGQVGLVGMWDVVAFDEVAGIKPKEKDVIQIMKGYMASGQFSVGKAQVQAKASMVFVGNINQSVETLLKTSSLFDPFPPEMGQDTAFLDRFHCYIPGWEIPKYRPDSFTNDYGFITDYLSEFLKEMRKDNYSDIVDKYFRLGNNLNQRDTIAVRKMMSGFMKLVYPDGKATKEQIQEVIDISLELRRRVKEQLKKIGGMEFYDVNFSYFDNETFEEKYVSVPEQGGGKLIPEGMGKPGCVYTVGKSKTGMVGCYRLETQMMPGNGKLTLTGLGTSSEIKQGPNTAFNYIKANGNSISGQISTTTRDYIVSYQDMQGIGMTPSLAMTTLIALCSSALNKTPLNSMAILGDFTIGGTLIKVENLASTLQVCLDSGAKKVLLPMTSAADLGSVPSDLVGAFSLIFYSSPEEAVFKALGVE